MSCPRTLWHWTAGPGIEPPTFQLVGDHFTSSAAAALCNITIYWTFVMTIHFTFYSKNSRKHWYIIIYSKRKNIFPNNHKLLCSMWLWADFLWLTHLCLWFLSSVNSGTKFNLSVAVLQARMLISSLHTLKAKLDQSTLVKALELLPPCFSLFCHQSLFLVAKVLLQHERQAYIAHYRHMTSQTNTTFAWMLL